MGHKNETNKQKFTQLTGDTLNIYISLNSQRVGHLFMSHCNNAIVGEKKRSRGRGVARDWGQINYSGKCKKKEKRNKRTETSEMNNQELKYKINP